MPNWARSLSSMSPNASQGQTTAESAGQKHNVSPDATCKHAKAPDYTSSSASPPRPSIPGTSLSNLRGNKNRTQMLNILFDWRCWMSSLMFNVRMWRSPLLSGFGSLALECPGLLLLELGRSGLGALSCCCCCVHVCKTNKDPNMRWLKCSIQWL